MLKQLISEIKGSEIIISWKAVKDFGHYEVVRCISNSNQWIFLDKNLLLTNFIDKTTKKQTNLTYRVRAVNISGPGPWSDITSVSNIKDAYSL